MAKIENLTAEQEGKLEAYYEKWVKVGLQTGPCDKGRIAEVMEVVYKAGGLPPPKEIIWVNDPVAGIRRCRELEGLPRESHDIYWGGFGQQDASWLSYYDFARQVLGLEKETELLKGLLELSSYGWWWPYHDVVVICERPDELSVDKEGNLHGDGKAALTYPGGYSQYWLHGVRVEKWMATEDPKDWTFEKIVAITNVDQRREVVARFGADRLWKQATIIDKKDEYQLGTVKIANQERTYLRMRNASDPKLTHIEGVPNDIRTVKAANLWRIGKKEEDIDSKGSDWWQHGDVVLVPVGATKIKAKPKAKA